MPSGLDGVGATAGAARRCWWSRRWARSTRSARRTRWATNWTRCATCSCVQPGEGDPGMTPARQPTGKFARPAFLASADPVDARPAPALDLAVLSTAPPATIHAALDGLHGEDIAYLVARQPLDVAERVLRALSAELAAQVVECLDSDRRADLVERLGIPHAARILDEMKADERADTLGELDAPVAEAVMAQMEPAQAAEARTLAKWPEHSAGAHMTTEALRVAQNLNVAEVEALVRKHGAEAETVYYVFVVSPTGVLAGVVSLRELLLADPVRRVADIMRPDVVAVHPSQSIEDAARLISHYNLIALPVIDGERCLLGLVTVDDVMDIIADTTTADFHRVGAVQPVDTSYFHTKPVTWFAKRAPWLVGLFLGEILTGDMLSGFESVFQRVTALVFFIPLILSSGGNAGSQSASIVIRALAVGEVRLGHALRVLAREASMGVALGLLLGTIGVARALIWGNGGDLAIVVGTSLVCVVLTGTVLGSMMPMLLERLGLDPAVSSTPFIASLSDLLGILVYFSIAKAVLGL
ncbi:MAG: magnesium transporter [Myxococcales bacterium]|nr:magnesium transporter [Myxococcales bacterium]